MKILDVSDWQLNIDYAQVAKQVDGVILRCGVTGWGTANQCSTDDCFEKHYAGFKAVGLPVGAYYYSAADTISKAQEEAEYCKKILAGKQFEFPIYYDIENPQRMDKLSKEQLTAQVIAWCDKMEQAGYFVGVYSYTSFINEKLDIAALAQRYTIWLADYRQNYDRTIPRDMHQYTSTAQIAGIAGGVDMNNLFYNDLPSIIQKGGFNGFAKEPTSNVQLYKVVFGGCSEGDKGTALVLGQKLGLDCSVTNADNGLYLVTYSPMTAGDKLAVEQLGKQLAVPVQSSAV